MGSLDEENNLSYVTADYQLIWMGLRQDDEGGYYWTDGTPLDYTHYKTDQPDDYHGVDNCIINDWYYSYSNGWESHNCESEMPFFCEVVAGMVAPTTAAPPTVPPALPCDEGQHDFGCGVSILGKQNQVHYCLKLTRFKGNYCLFF